jgi:transcriptional regulator with GAF, ATPase, and Fis domain/tetratricopeptide (TPR) repeat protein
VLAIPPRYEALRRLGAGGGGEVWAVRDKVTDEPLAFKVLADNAGASEVMALVREAMALSGLEGLGVPRVVAFGALAESGRRFMVRELVEGESLEDILDMPNGVPWIEPLARASEQLTVLHRAGLLHGDIKPANVIVGDGGKATLVDLGLAAPWREGGTVPQGLTPKYAAPELFQGEALTVRAEVYALGATLADALERRGDELEAPARASLSKIAARATQTAPSARYPSVDELASALRLAAGLAAKMFREEAAWPVLGNEIAAQMLLAEVNALEPGAALAIEGPEGAGKTTLARRLGWTLGVEGRPLATIAAPPLRAGGMTSSEAVALALSPWATRPAGDASVSQLVLIVDDVGALDDTGRAAIRRATDRGARVVATCSAELASCLTSTTCAHFVVPALDARTADELVRRAMPSLPDAIRTHLIAKSGARPGPLRAFIKRLAGRAVVSAEEVDTILASEPGTVPPPSMTRREGLLKVDQLLDTGRFDEATRELDRLGTPLTPEETVRIAVARGRVAYGRGEAAEALALLDEVEAQAAKSPQRRAWQVTRARACLRAGRYKEAEDMAESVIRAHGDDAIAADALAIRGLAFVYDGKDPLAKTELARAVDVAAKVKDRRVQAIALCSLAIAQQRSGQSAEARATYEAALTQAEGARDAATVATIRLNLSNLAQFDGDLALGLGHLEAAVDMGRRTGALVAMQQALLNLANLDLYLGRYARASASIESLLAQKDQLSAVARADLLGLQADLLARTGELARAAELYEACAAAREAQGRPLDAAEAELEGLLVRTRDPSAKAHGLDREFAELRAKVGDKGFLEHQALANLVKGAIALLAGDETAARTALDEALAQAEKAGRREWAWRALDARARLASSQGHSALAHRDIDSALAMLEETAAKLPRDLREVFWDDPRRRALRQAHFATVPANAAGARVFSSPTAAARTGNTTLLGGPRPTEERLALIFEITRELATEHDLPRLLTKVTDHAIALLGAERGFVVLANEQGELLAHAARHRKGDEPHANFSRSVAETVVRTGEPVIATSARDDVRLAEAVSVHQLMIQSIACVPIRGSPPVGRPIGALYLETRIRPGKQFEAELPTLAAFADQAAIAIENARLLEENRARAEALAKVNAELEQARDKLAEILGRRTEQLTAARRDLKQVRAELRGHFGYAGLVGTSAPMRKLYGLMDRVKDTDVALLVTGESGTGKEVVARAVHDAGARAKRAFLGVNCGAIPANLLESELFGHVRGAFTGADRDAKGLLREAEGGTILLDEIGEMPKKMQAGLLRALQEKTVRPVGSSKEEPVDTRVIAATNRDLAQMVAEGTFREDLYYRLNVIQLKIPALRERPEDIPPLIDHFLTLFSARYRRERKGVEREALRYLCAYDWPGNVRQLEHALLNAWLMGDGTEITKGDLELPDSRAQTSGAPAGPRGQEGRGGRAQNMNDFKDTERERILNALSVCNWNRVQASKMIGVPRRTFYRRLKQYGIL